MININIKREKILHKGYATKADIKKFIPCGHERSVQIYDEIRSEVELSGKKNLHNSVLAKRLLSYVGLTEKQVVDYAAKEKADFAESTSSN